jgi:hypothetical protein
MRLRIGSLVRPNNEAVVVPSYSPIYDFTRRVQAMKIRWDITGRVVNYPVATQGLTSGEIRTLEQAFKSNSPYLALLEDESNSPTAFELNPSSLLQGPFLVDYSFPASEKEVFATGVAYRAVFEAVQSISAGKDLIEFEEEISREPGGVHHVYVGGAVNFPERQTAFKNKVWKYTQSGYAVGLLAHPDAPEPIWPFALMSQPNVTLSGPQFKSTKYDTHYRISWEYRFEYHLPLTGLPNRANVR